MAVQLSQCPSRIYKKPLGYASGLAPEEEKRRGNGKSRNEVQQSRRLVCDQGASASEEPLPPQLKRAVRGGPVTNRTGFICQNDKTSSGLHFTQSQIQELRSLPDVMGSHLPATQCHSLGAAETQDLSGPLPASPARR